MSRNHAKAGDYPGAMEARGVPKVCGYQHRIKDWGPCRGLVRQREGQTLQRDHVDELQDAPWQDPKTAWLIFACEHHHNCKTQEAKAKRRAAKEGRMADPVTRLPKAPVGGKKGATRATPRKGASWKRWLVNTAAVSALVLVGLSFWFNITDPILAVALPWVPWVLVLVVSAACGRYGRRAYRWLVRKRNEERSDWLLAKAAGIARKMQCAPDAVHIEPRGRGAWTREGLCVRGRVTYPDHVLDDDPKLRKAVEAHWRHKLGVPDLVIEWNVGRNWFDYREPARQAGPVLPTGPEPPEAEAPRDAHEKAEDKLAHVMESVDKRAKGEWSHRLIRHDDRGPLEFVITWPPDFDAASDEQRVKLMETINLGLSATGRWRADDWDGERRVLRVSRRPPLDPFIPNPGHAERVSWHLIPLGRDESGASVIFDALTIPHALVVGATRRGKSVCLRTIIFGVLNPPSGTPLIDVPAVVLLDPKEVEFAGYEGMSGVVEVATEEEQMAAAVERVLLEQKRRYRWKKQRKVPLTSHRPIYLIIDEYQEFCEALNEAHVNKKGTTGKEHPAVAWTRRIARLGAAARIFLILATQRPDLDWFKGVLRENIQYRLAFGKLSPEASKMAFARQDIGRDIPDQMNGRPLRGRGNCSVGDDGRPREFQAFWTPNPDEGEDRSPADAALLAALIPRQRPGLEEPMWDLDRLREEFGTDEDDDTDEEAGSGTSSSRYRGNGRGRTQTAPRPRQRAQQTPKPRQEAPRQKPAAGPVGLPFLNTCAMTGQARWVKLEDGTEVRVDKVEPDDTAEGYILVEGVARDGSPQALSFPEGWQFELADEQ